MTKKPVVGIILTHFHADHAYGTAGELFGAKTSKSITNRIFFNVFPSEFLRGRQEGEVEIFAHDSFPTYFRQVTLRHMLINESYVNHMNPNSTGDGCTFPNNLPSSSPSGFQKM